ncbi:SDR family oxidoreductase [Actinomadura viridis]|uniref:NAD(P)-dependent dehydrogenase (Short-subunit alcohol dehydrogenase family) n=1 Tax=Actinomadura viridis TaxID=58110 RepID=A0A931DEE5_9ACTN|nr:SDR family oxidoreductase [Actinomadura viridis]MBG6086041.1 NAD(P)-dependent dehydrogenase (short-subunit alcohol dehydrogenase family) [Actinomadura viridis]
MSVTLITGAATGIGNVTARRLAGDGHTVYASMRDPAGRDADHAAELRDLAVRDGVDLRVVELDVTGERSAEAAVATILDDAGRLDVVVHNAGHLCVGYVEAFTPEDIEDLFDVNAIGAHRVNRAVLPHMRERRAGTLLYVGSTIGVTTPPFLGPYVASKVAFDALAVVTSYETNPFGIETTIVMPGAITQGTQHFPNAGRAGDTAVAQAYAMLDPLVARNEAATESLFVPGVEPSPVPVADEIARILALPFGDKPMRSVVDFTDSGVEEVNEIARQTREGFVTRMGFGELLRPRRE